MNKSFVIGKLLVKQLGELTSIQLRREYDLVLAVVSWEKRCTAALTSISGLSAPIRFLRFNSSDPAVHAAKDTVVKKFSDAGLTGERVPLDESTNFFSNSFRLEEFLTDQFVAVGRPLKVLMDMTCVPKSYLMFIIGLGFSRSMFCQLDCVYSEGEYKLGQGHEPSPKLIASTAARVIISDGNWGSQQIPYLESNNPIPGKRDVIAALGAEVALSVPFIEKYEPRRLALTLITESVVQTPDKLIDSERVALSELLAEPIVTRWDVPVGDAATLVERATEFCRRSGAEAITGIALGSKPHALALSLVALNEPNLEVVARIPARYKALDVAPKGSFFVFEITDRFEPNAYV